MSTSSEPDDRTQPAGGQGIAGGGLNPLEDLRVLEIGSDMAMSFGCRLLADLGAEVIKIEPPGAGDPLRREGPFAGDPASAGASALFGYLNAGKRSVTIDTASPSGDDLVARLLAGADLVVWAPRGTPSPILERVLAGESDSAPTLMTVTPYGISGPGANRPGTPFIVQHSSGFALHQASPVTDPDTTPPVACADREAALTVGTVVAISALWGVETAKQSERAPIIDLSAEDVFAQMLVEPFAEANASDKPFSRRRIPGSGTAVVGGLVWFLPCADGAVLVSPREDHQWANWLKVMGEPAWANDPELCGSRPIRTQNAEKLQELMAAWSLTQQANDIFIAAQQQRVACFPLSSGEDLLANPQLQHRQFFSTLKQSDGHSIAMPGLPFLMRDSAGRVLERARTLTSPDLAQDNGAVLRGTLGLDEAKAELLARHKII